MKVLLINTPILDLLPSVKPSDCMTAELVNEGEILMSFKTWTLFHKDWLRALIRIWVHSLSCGVHSKVINSKKICTPGMTCPITAQPRGLSGEM